MSFQSRLPARCVARLRPEGCADIAWKAVLLRGLRTSVCGCRVCLLTHCISANRNSQRNTPSVHQRSREESTQQMALVSCAVMHVSRPDLPSHCSCSLPCSLISRYPPTGALRYKRKTCSDDSSQTGTLDDVGALLPRVEALC